MPSSRGSSQPKDGTQISGMPGSLIAEPPAKPSNTEVGSLSLLQGIFLTQEQILDFIKLFFSIYRDDPTVFHFQFFSKLLYTDRFSKVNECYTHRGTKTNGLCYVVLCIDWGRLPQISCFTLSLKCFSSDPDNYSNVETGNLLQFSHPPRAGPGLLTLLFFPPSSFILPSFVVLYILFHWSGTPVSSQLVNCKHFCI